MTAAPFHLLDLPVSKLADALGGLDYDQLSVLYDAEEHGKTRKGALAAIDAAREALAAPEAEPLRAALEAEAEPEPAVEGPALSVSPEAAPAPEAAPTGKKYVRLDPPLPELPYVEVAPPSEYDEIGPDFEEPEESVAPTKVRVPDSSRSGGKAHVIPAPPPVKTRPDGGGGRPLPERAFATARPVERNAIIPPGAAKRAPTENPIHKIRVPDSALAPRPASTKPRHEEPKVPVMAPRNDSNDPADLLDQAIRLISRAAGRASDAHARAALSDLRATARQILDTLE